MITCTLEIKENVEDLYKIFLPERLKSDRATCKITKKGGKLRFEINANDAVSMKAFLNSILKIIQTYDKIK